MNFSKFVLMLAVLTLLFSGCSEKEKVVDNQAQAFKVLQTALLDTNSIFEQTTTQQNNAVPILNPHYGSDLNKVETKLNQNFDQKITKELMEHYLTTQKKNESIVLKANENGAVDSYFQIHNPTKLNLSDFIIEGDSKLYKFTTKNHHTFTIKWIDSKTGYKVTDYI
ncbi:hypothetical protein [Paenibacillus kandeliae]|uniref:hypothetical protein n=1 Tax=Paenibacillus kandeliae TaxID=3231269 RepID=UPI00345A2809